MIDAILVTLRETWSGYVQGLRLVIPRLLAMLSVVAGRLADRRRRPRSSPRASSAGCGSRACPSARGPRSCSARPSCLPPTASPPPRSSGSSSWASCWPVSTPRLRHAAGAPGGVGPCSCPRIASASSYPRRSASSWPTSSGASCSSRPSTPAGRRPGSPPAPLVRHGHVAAAMALDQIGLARSIVLTAFAIVVGAVMLAVAIAVGIGTGPLVGACSRTGCRGGRGADPDGSSHL